MCHKFMSSAIKDEIHILSDGVGQTVLSNVEMYLIYLVVLFTLNTTVKK